MKIDTLVEETQARVPIGASGQEAVIDWLKKQLKDRLQVISVADVGDRGVDIDTLIDGKPIRFEVKNVNDPKKIRTSIYVTRMHLDPQKKNSKVIDRFIQSVTGMPSFNVWIAKARNKDKEIGYPGQPGVTNKSGSLPTGRTSRSPQYLSAARLKHSQRLSDNDVTYFVIRHAPQNAIHCFFTGYGENVLSSEPVPMPFSVMLDTYGESAGFGVMNIALKATFKL